MVGPGFEPRAVYIHDLCSVMLYYFPHTSCTLSEDFTKWVLEKVSISLEKHLLKQNEEVGLLLEMHTILIFFL